MSRSTKSKGKSSEETDTEQPRAPEVNDDKDPSPARSIDPLRGASFAEYQEYMVTIARLFVHEERFLVVVVVVYTQYTPVATGRVSSTYAFT
jgi:hypothetical protein